MSPIVDKVRRLVRPEIQALKAYHVPDATGLIKLDAMENPYSWPEEIKPAWFDALRRVELNRYPDPGMRALKESLGRYLDVPKNAALLLGNGSDELIQMILLACARPGAVVAAPRPSFSMYRQIAIATGMEFIEVPLTPDFALDIGPWRQVLTQRQPAVVFLSYPNNPTGNLFTGADIETLIKEAPGLVVVDEAYHAFAGETFLPRLAAHDNLLVLRTLSKSGLAGLRLGMLAGAPAWLDEFDKLRLPYNVGSLTQASALFVLEHASMLEAQAAKIRADREDLYQRLAGRPNVTVWPSRANFILFRVNGRPAGEIFETLRDAGVLIKNLHAPGALEGCLRVTVGTPSENSAFLDALRRAI